MDIDKIRTLIDLMEEKELVTLKLEQGDESISLTRHYNSPVPTMVTSAAPQTAEVAPPVDTSSEIVETSPMVGVFYIAPSPNDAPFVSPGQKVQAGDTLGIIEAMKIMNPLEATQSGIVDAILVENGDVVQFGQPIIRYRK